MSQCASNELWALSTHTADMLGLSGGPLLLTPCEHSPDCNRHRHFVAARLYLSPHRTATSSIYEITLDRVRFTIETHLLGISARPVRVDSEQARLFVHATWSVACKMSP
jgi:hypothetical protein